MASLEQALATVPGLGGFLGRRQMLQSEDAAGLQQAQSMLTLEGVLENRATQRNERMRQERYRTELAAAGDDPRAQAMVAARYGQPSDVLRIRQDQLNREAARDASIAAQALSREERAAREARDNQFREDQQRRQQAFQESQSAAQRAFQDDQNRQRAADREALARMVPQPVTAVTIQDPNDPTGAGTIVVDGRTGRPIGRGPKLTQTGAMDAKRAFNAQGIGAALQSAEDLLLGVTRNAAGEPVGGQARPTGSVIGAGMDAAYGVVGGATEGAQRAADLEVVGGRLLQMVPRFEGPQSDRDVAEYRRMAGRIGDRTVPIAARVSALKKMREMYGSYERGEDGRRLGTGGATGDFGNPGGPRLPFSPEQIQQEINRREGQRGGR